MTHEGKVGGALFAEPLHRDLDVVHPEANVIERGKVNRGFFLNIERLHDVNLDGEGAAA